MTLPFDHKAFLNHVAHRPGVYRMYNEAGVVIYVGKAKNLQKRLSSYFRKTLDGPKTRALVSQIADIDVTITSTETEALILEHNYIKKYQPKYNVLLRDDKSYPYLFLSAHAHPRLSIHRGAKKRKGEYFGPYPDSGSARAVLLLLQKIFPIRQCEDSVYANRQRPCLMYQIKRCSAPCIKGLISDTDYAQLVDCVKLFLKGRDKRILETLVAQMDKASQLLEFEKAAQLRDQIAAVRRIVKPQFVSSESGGDIDVIGIASDLGAVCLHLLMIRNGQILGSRSYFPKVPDNAADKEVLLSFLNQYYLTVMTEGAVPHRIITQMSPNKEIALLQEALQTKAERKVVFHLQPKGDKAKYLSMAMTNAQSALQAKLQHKMTISQRLQALSLCLKKDIERMECFDISHTMGEATIASCVVFGAEGPIKAEYRRYKISGITAGDDYAAMAQVLMRRYAKQIDADKIPDLIVIDGGKGQLNKAVEILKACWEAWPKKPLLLGVAKGVSRKAGLETLLLASGETFALPSDSPALHLLQHIRDESHDHAITGHRLARGKKRTKSALEEIRGVGQKRRQALLKYLGGMQELKRASIEDIANVPGISRPLAEVIFNTLNE